MMARRSKSKSPARSRSRGKSGDAKRKLKGAPFRSARARVQIVKGALPRLNKLLLSHDAVKRSIALSKESYMSGKDTKFDLKSAETSLDLLKQELALALGAIRAGLGDKPVRMRLTAPMTITTTVTTGVTNTVNIASSSNWLIPSACTEWATCAALFEEYKCLGGHVDLNYSNQNAYGGTIGSINTSQSDTMPMIAYDADDGTAATSSIQLTQAAQHKWLPVWVNGPNGSVTSSPSSHHFKWHVPRGTVSGGSQSLNGEPGTEWVTVAGVVNAGYLKFFHIGTIISATITGAGIVYFDLEFRCRS